MIWFRSLRVYVLMSLLILLVGALVLLFTDKIDTHLAINATHTPFQDFLFSYLTHLGGGTGVIIGTFVFSILYWKRYKISLFLFGAINLLLLVSITQFLKLVIFADALRPTAFIKEHVLHTAPGVEMHTYNSFPSGHTAAGFAFFGFVAFIYRANKWAQFLCAVMAMLIGYSRIYLSQHFLEDAVFGGTIGLVCCAVSYLLVRSTRMGAPLRS